MILLDMRTLVFSNVVFDILCMLVILLLWYEGRKRFAGTGFWVFDFAFQTAAMFLIVLRGSIPDWMSMVLANTLVTGGAILGYMGLGRFVGKKISQGHNYVLLAAFACVHAYFTLVQPNLAARNLNLAAGLLIICFQCMWFSMYRVEPGMRRLTFGVGMVFGGYCLVSLARIVGFFTGTRAANDYFQSSAFESLILISYQALFILLTYSLVLMANKRLLLEVKTQEEKFAKAFHSSPYAITLTRLSDGQIIEVNDGFLNIAGYRYAEAIGKSTVDLHLWDREEDRMAAVNELSKSGKVRGREFQFRKKSGEMITGIFSADIMPINNQELVLSSISDITERKRAEIALQESEQRWATTLASIGDAVIATDVEARITFMNAVAENLTGWALSEAVAGPVTKVFNIVNEQTRRNVENPVAKVLEQGNIIGLANHTLLVRKDGTEVPIDDSGAPIRDPNGKTMGVVLVFRDITERKKAEQALRESEAKANALIKYAPTGIYEIDYRGPSFISVNDAMCQILGYTREELFSIGPSALLDANGRALFADRIRRQLAGEKIEESVEYRVRKKDGSLIDAILNVSLDAGGEPGRALVVAHDVTERKRAEEALRESEVKYRNLFENMAEEVHFWKLVRDEEERIKTWRLVDANPPTLKTWGKKIEEIKGKTTDEIFGPGATEHYMPVVQKIMTEGVPYSFEDYFPHLDKYFRFTSVPLGEYFITTGADITNLKKANEALRASEERFSRLYSSMTEGVAQHEVIYDTAGQPIDYIILDVNPAYETITGLGKDRIIGKKASNIYSTGEAPYLDLYSRVASSGQAESLETYFPPMKKHFYISAFSPGKGKFATVFQDITERKQSEEELKTALQRFYTVLSSMYASILLVADDGRIEFANQAFCDFFGLKNSPADLTGLTSPEMIEKIRNAYLHPNEEVTKIRQMVGRGQPVKGEEIAMRGGRTCLRDFIPIYVDGKSYGRLWIHVEITERKKAEEALRDYSRLLDDVIDGSTSPIFLKDNDGKFITINASLERMLGKSRQELKGKTDYDIAPKEVADYWRSHDTKVMATGKAIQIEEVADLQDGHHIFLANKFPLVNAHGQVYGVGAISHDITERKRMEEELRRSHDELELRVQERTAEVYRQAEMLDLAHDAIVVRQMDGIITYWNEGATEMYGWGKGEALGKIICDLLESEFPIPRDEILTKVVQEGGWEGELIHTRKDGKKINVLSRWALQKDEKGRPPEIMVINHDITQRLRLEEQLRQAQKMEAIGTLTGGIAHDFNNILGAIVINSEMALLDLPGGSGLRANLDQILKSGLRGKDLVKQMLLFSRKSEKKQAVLTLTPLIKETFKLLRSSIPTTVQMRLLLETESDAVSADPSQIQQVIMNLCTNAAYAMRGTTGSIDISLQGITFGSTDLPEADMQPGDYLVLSVKDTGSGMDEEVKKRIFEPFFTTKPVGEGTGLGLSVAYGIVKSHKGNITVYSEPGKGSIFKVYLPKVDTGASVSPETPKAIPIPRGNERILVVDDEEIIINSVRNMLEHLGYKVTALMDNREALKLFSEKPSEFDLVMTDQTMPFMTGEDLGKEFMRIRPDIPIILCTGYSDLISSEKATAMGFRGFIMKPFTVREGANLVRSILDQKATSNLRKNP